ncbi:hypothetical protein [Sphingobacterium siyangense]|uniref:hypothetical protein n=1 Tax=Sphingobacterium siyangense TaxID=459529 RepID=UPI002FD9BB67
MILIITHKRDFTADYLINILNERNIGYRRFNCEDILSVDVSFKYTPDFKYSFLGESNYSSVWFRRTMLPEIDIASFEEKKYVLGEIDNFIKNIFSVIDAKWLSKPSSVYNAENKLYQLKVAKDIGFNIPETLITTNKQEVIAFYERKKNIIVKPISQTRIDSYNKPQFIFTSKVTSSQIESIEAYDLTPCIFQEEIKKELELRVTVVKDRVFTAQVNSQQDKETLTDWRRKKLEFTTFELPQDQQYLCRKLLGEMDLKFGAIDLILSPDGKYTFLEINPNGQWVWIENETGLNISEAIIDELS